MSTTELPPITDKERHHQQRPSSRSTSKSSLHQITAAVSSKPYYTRLATGTSPLHRNHSDSSLKGLILLGGGGGGRGGGGFGGGIPSSTVTASQNPGSMNSFHNGGGGGGGSRRDVGGDLGGMVMPSTHLLHRSSSRALSWCATDNSGGSIPRLETLFERKDAGLSSSTAGGLRGDGRGKERGGAGGSISSLNNLNGNSFYIPNARDTPPPLFQVLRNINNNKSKTPSNNNNNNVIPPRSVSVSCTRRSDSEELAKIKGRKERLQSEYGGTAEIETFSTVEQFGHKGMRRSMSDNKLVEKKNVRNARQYSSRHLSVSRMEKLTENRKLSRVGGASTMSMTKGTGMRRVGSVSALNNVAANNRFGIDSNQDSENVDGGLEDSEEDEEETTDRIREWLLGLDCADVPPEPVIEYADDPSQTDTALHIVYQEDS